MSDIEKINTDKPIDNGGITVRYPFGEGEGRDAKISSQDIKTQASNLLNKFKPLRRFESKTFSSLYSMMNDGTLGIYQSDLPYPGLSNFTLKSQIDIGVAPFLLVKDHYIFAYGDYKYIACPNRNIKYLDSSFNVSEINIGNRFDHLFKKNNNTLFSLVDRTIYEVDLTNNTSSVYGTLDNAVEYPVTDILYDSINNKFVIFNSIEENDIKILDNSLNLVSSINTRTPYLDGNGDQASYATSICNNKNGKVLIILDVLDDPSDIYSTVTKNIEIDLSNNSHTEVNSSDPIIIKYYVDLFETNYVFLQQQDNKHRIYNSSDEIIATMTASFYGDTYSNSKVLFIDQTSSLIVQQNHNTYAGRCVYDLKSVSSTNPQKLVELDS